MSLRVPLILSALLLIGAAPTTQATAPLVTVAVAQETATPDAAAQEPITSSGLPVRDSAPRTLRAYWHVFIAFGITWLLLFGYAVSVGRRFGRLEQELGRLEGL